MGSLRIDSSTYVDSFEDISLGQDFNASKSIFDDTSGVLLGFPSDEVHFKSQENCVSVLNQSNNQGLRLPFYTMDSMMLASGDISAAFGTSLFQQHAAMSDHNTEQESSCSGQWPLQNFTTLQPYQAGSTLTAQSGLSWPASTSINVDTSTIIPTGMGIDGHVISKMYNSSIRGIQADSSSSCSHQRVSESPKTINATKERENSEMEIGGLLKSILKSAPSGKGIVKKKRKHLTRSKRGSGHQMTEEYTGNLHGNAVDVQHMHNRQKRKFQCKFVDNAGKPCHALFQREEHLKRHKAIHSGEKPFKCVLPAAYKCDKYFNRRDNLRDHYKTHLSAAKAGRNPRVKFEDFYELLRDIEEPDEVEKTARMLEKWRTDGKHLKEEHHPRCQQ